MKVAILGAECTGKTSLTQALATALEVRGQRAICVPEALREWCDEHGRTPQAHEQIQIASTQANRVLRAPACDVLLADTTPLMTAIYSEVLLDDSSLYSFALSHHATYDLVLVTGLDLPWLADGIQRDGKYMQIQIDARLREILQRNGLPFSMVYGAQEQRCSSAMAAIDQCAARIGRGAAQADTRQPTWHWICEKCSDAQCEHHLFTQLLASALAPPN
jgi:hypothetical protein